VTHSSKSIRNQQDMKFKPDILKKSQMLAKKVHQVGSSYNPQQGPYPRSTKPEDRLLVSGKAAEDRLNQMKRDHEATLVADCTFKPRLNPKTHEIIRSTDRQGGSEKYLTLFQDAAIKEDFLQKHAQDFYEKVCPFNPTLSKQPEDIKNKINAADYRARGEQWLKRRAEEEKQKTKVERRDPEIGKGKQSKRPPNVKIHEYLYASVDKKAQDLDALRKTQEMELANSKHKYDVSEKLIWDNMDSKLKVLFLALDLDCDGKVTNDDINAGSLDPELQQLMEPLFQESKIGTIELDEAEFIEACKEVIKVWLRLTTSRRTSPKSTVLSTDIWLGDSTRTTLRVRRSERNQRSTSYRGL
jgi:hypothetical protein